MLDLSIRPQTATRVDRAGMGWLRRLAAAFARFRRYRSGLRALRELEPHLLHDIGLEPFELRAAAWTGRPTWRNRTPSLLLRRQP